MRAPEEAYNAKSRRIEWKLDIFFNGAYQDPVSIVRDNFLVSAEVLEETNANIVFLGDYLDGYPWEWGTDPDLEYDVVEDV